jgi:hypothetical protein
VTEPGTGPTTPQSRPASAARTSQRTRFRAGAVIALAVAAGLILWLSLRKDDSESAPKAVSAAELQSLATSVGHPVFWIGELEGNTLELTKASNGAIVVRYLPPGVSVGAQGEYWTVATYPFRDTYAAIQKIAKQRDITSIKLAHGGLAEYANSNPNDVHAAYPGIDYQAEVFAPRGRAVELVKEGRLTSFGGPEGGPVPSSEPKPKAVSPAGLKALASKLGHALYWAGRKDGSTYELTRVPNGGLIIRYLPPGVQVGSAKSYLSVGTYPFKDAYAGIQRAGKPAGQKTFKLKGGGLAVYNSKDPSNVHFAYPNSDVQIEVFDPAKKAQQLVATGRIVSIG